MSCKPQEGRIFFTFPEVLSLVEVKILICEKKNPHIDLPGIELGALVMRA
jgi:hypothetical protein